jgi:hypothetical protein
MRAARRQGEWLRARLGGAAPASAHASAGATRAALLEVSSVLARVVIQPNAAAAEAAGTGTGAPELR